MTFNMAQYQAVTGKVTTGVDSLGAKIPELISAVNSVAGAWYVPEPVKEAVIWLGKEIVRIAEWIYNKILDLLKGVAMPALMFDEAWKWESVRGKADTVASGLTPQIVSISSDWQGAAASRYANAVQNQSAAAAQVASIADATANCLTVCAAAGMAFYIALGIIIVQFLMAMAEAGALCLSVVFALPGLAAAAGAAGVDTGLIIAAVVALGALLTAQATEMVTLHGQAVDPTAFPGGHWPRAVNA